MHSEDCFSQGALFESKQAAVAALDSYLLEKGKTKRFISSRTGYSQYGCSDRDCAFFCSFHQSKNGLWRLSSLKGIQHNPCTGVARLKQREIAEKLMESDQLLMGCKAVDVKSSLEYQAGAIVSIATIYHARAATKKKFTLSWVESFDYIHSFVQKYNEQNPGGHSAYKLDKQSGTFIGVCFVAQIPVEAMKSLKPVVSLDMCHMRSDWKQGRVVKLVGQDWNKQNVDIGVGVVDAESAENYIWFLQQVRVACNFSSTPMVTNYYFVRVVHGGDCSEKYS